MRVGVLYLIGVLLLLFSPAWSGSGNKPSDSDMKLQLLYEGSASPPVASPAESFSNQRVGSTAPKKEKITQTDMRKISESGHPYLVIIFIVGAIGGLVFFYHKSKKNGEEEEPW